MEWSNGMKLTVPDRLKKLRSLMAERDIDAVIVPTGDYHMSEYECDHFKCRSHITGFTGSDGTAVIFRDEALASGLWTDSRYFIQAEQQLKGSGLRLFKIGDIDTLPVAKHIIDQFDSIIENSPEQDIPTLQVAVDGRVVNFDSFANWYDDLADAGITLLDDMDLIGEIWDGRPQLPQNPVYEYDLKYAGKCRKEKLADLATELEAQGAEGFLLTKTDDIAWLLNIRGSDIHCTPVPLCYFMLEHLGSSEAIDYCPTLFVNIDSVEDTLRNSLEADGITIKPYDEITVALSETGCSSMLVSTLDTNSYLYGCIPDNVYIIEEPNPTQMMKSVKNSVEIEGTKNAHLRDGVAVTKFICWLKTTFCNSITELSAAEKLFELRSQQDDFVSNSFDPIIAYGQHAAIVHYQATEESSATLTPRGLLLCDTGAQYLDGTTDVTRTIALGPLTDEERHMSTLVLKGHIALASAVFPRGLNGANLDYLAHAPLWKEGKDYGHGTGHGVGHFLSVHEGPNNIHWTRNGAIGTTPAFEPGMITSCEPGYYEEGKFGIRHESLILCKEYRPLAAESNDADDDAGKFLCFEELTLVPFDLDAIDTSLLTDEEKGFLNDYHSTVYKKLAPHMSKDELAWLKHATRNI